MMKDFSAEVHGCHHYDATGALTTPVYLSATFRHPAFRRSTGYDYGRMANPTRSALEEAIAHLPDFRMDLIYQETGRLPVHYAKVMLKITAEEIAALAGVALVREGGRKNG